MIYTTLMFLFPYKTTVFFEKIRKERPILFKELKKRKSVNWLALIGGPIKDELEREGLIGKNIFLKTYNRIMYLLFGSDFGSALSARANSKKKIGDIKGACDS